MTTTLAGPKAPEALKLTLRTGTSGLDMTSVASCSLSVRRPNGEVVTWDTTVAEKTAAACVATHVFDADGLEADLPGAYLITPSVVASGTPRRCAPFKIHLTPPPTP